MKGVIRGSGDKTKYFIDGREVTAEEFNAAFPDKKIGWFGGNLPKCWPMRSDALAVNPDQVQEAIADSAKNGVPTHFDADGRPVFRDSKHFRQYCERYGYYARNGGYSDPQRK